MKRICILNHGLASGGTDTFVVNVINELSKTGGYRITLCMAVDEGSGPQKREGEVFDKVDEIYRTSDLNGPLKVIKHSWRLYRLLRTRRIDIIHANMDLFNGVNMFVAWLAGVPVRVCHSHNSQSQYEAISKRHTAVAIYRWIMRRMCWLFSTQRCGCSELAMDYLFESRWKDNKNSRVIYNGIPLSNYEKKSIAGKRKSLDVQERKIVAVVGRIAAQKNPRFIISIMKELSRIRNDCVCLWCGEGELLSEMRTMCEEYNVEEMVRFLGVRSDVKEILQISDAFLMPSLFEGLPYSLIEAQAAGVPCVVSNTIAQEIDCGLCRFVSIEEPAKVWAEILSTTVDAKKPEVDRRKMAGFDSAEMVKALERVYA